MGNDHYFLSVIWIDLTGSWINFNLFHVDPYNQIFQLKEKEFHKELERENSISHLIISFSSHYLIF